MLRSIKDLEGYAVGATDGTIGHVEDFYFDDRAWVVRYLVVEAGAWLSSRKVLISPIAIGRPDRGAAKNARPKSRASLSRRRTWHLRKSPEPALWASLASEACLFAPDSRQTIANPETHDDFISKRAVGIQCATRRTGAGRTDKCPVARRTALLDALHWLPYVAGALARQ